MKKLLSTVLCVCLLGMLFSMGAAAEEECSYNVVVYSDEYVEIELRSVSADNAYFGVTNVSDQSLQVDCYYFQLDDVEYTLDNTGYGTPIILIASGDTREYEFCDSYTAEEVGLKITSTECSRFSCLFGVWKEEGGLIEYAGVSDFALSEDAVEAMDEESGTVLYSDEYTEIEFTGISGNSMYFSVTNNTDDVIQVDCSYIQLDGTEYTFDNSGYGSPMLIIAPQGTRVYEYCGDTLEDEVIFEIESEECSEISGMFGVWQEQGGLIEYASIPTTALE